MGYTHYWEMSRDISERNFKKLTNDMKAIEAFIKNDEVCISDEITLHHPNGENEGVLYYSNTFGFNGNGLLGDDHESMHIDLGENNSFTFCKTARKPYDFAVQLILISLKYHIRSTRVTSDGDAEEWEIAIGNWNTIFPKRNVSFGFKQYVRGHKTLDGSMFIESKKLEKDLHG